MRMVIAAAAGLFMCAVAVAQEVRLQGAGATFPNPLYQRWVSEFQRTRPSVKIDYQSVGSGGGIKAITEKTVHFAGSDAPLSKKEIEAIGGPDSVVQVPSCTGAVVPAYNLPGVTDLKLTGELLAEIYMGKVSTWSDPKIVALNAGVKLPDSTITPVWRTDGSGTTFVWTNYLCTQSAKFKETIGPGKQVSWPAGQGGKGNEGVAAAVQQTKGSIGYIELNYALANKIDFASVKNTAGKCVKASAEAVSRAGESAADKLKGTILAADIWNQPGEEAYPISSFTYLIVYRDLANVKTRTEGQALVDFLWWSTHDGQSIAREMDYAPLSKGVQAKVSDALRAVTFHGETIEPKASK